MTASMGAMRIDIAGVTNVAIGAGVEPAMARGIARALAPYAPLDGPGDMPAGDAVVLIEPKSGTPNVWDIENAAGDGLVTAFDGESVFILRGGQACSIPDPLRDRPSIFSYTPHFPVRDLIRHYIRPAVALSALQCGAVVVHASAVAKDGRALLIGGWSESGKTEIALALAEAGAEFLSDKWTILRPDGSVCPFPASVGVRRWLLPYLPTLRSRLPKSARAQLAGAAVASVMSRPIRRPSGNPLLSRAGALATQMVAMADRAPLSLEQVRTVYRTGGDVTAPVRLGRVVLLSTVAPGCAPESRAIDPRTVAGRLALAAAFERRAYFAVSERARYAGAGDGRIDRQIVIAKEAGLIEAGLAGVGILEVRTPFPADPRPVAEMILRGLEGP